MLALSHQRSRFDLLLNSFWQTAGRLRTHFRRIREGIADDARCIASKRIRSQHADDLLAWSQHYLPHHFQKPPSAMHYEIAALLDAANKNNPVSPRPATSNKNDSVSPRPLGGEGPGVRGQAYTHAT